jgi:hypothetical protein
MTNVDVRNFGKLNMWPLASGELAVRPGLRRVLAPDGSRVFVGGFSVLNPFTGECWSYVFDCTSSVSTPRDLRLRVYDEDWQIFQTLSLNVNTAPRVITHCVVEGQILICSPDMPTLWGLVGSMIIFAVKVASDNPSTTAIDMPRGIVSSFNNRACIADGPSLYFSDPVAATGGDLRTFVGQNQNQRPAPVYGLHEGAGGNLVVLTQRGVYGLDSSAGAVGIVGSNGTAWQLLNHSETYTFASSAVVNGRVYALTKNGYRLVDIEGSDEVSLSDVVIPRVFGPRIASDDWRDARMYAGDAGPVVASDAAVSMHELAEEVRAWWRHPTSGNAFSVVGVLKTVDGTDLLMSADGVYEVCGNFDGDLTITPDGTQPKGVLYGRVRTNVGENPMARDIRTAASNGGEGSVRVSVRGEAAKIVTAPVDARALVVGTSVWGDARIYEPAPLAAIRTQHALDTHDMGVEIAVDLCETRVADTMDFTGSESATKRPGERGQG